MKNLNKLLIIGGASLDVLHLPDGQTVASAGGAGLYTACAARRAGAHVVFYAPRPVPMPAPLQPAAARLDWQGPVITPDELARFKIAHHGGGRATLVEAAWGAEARFHPEALPDDLARFDVIHIAAIGTAQRQLDFLQACRARGARRISAGTFGRAVYGQTDDVRALFAAADLFFMNENEANGLFGSAAAARTRPGAMLFVTLGERGARVLQGEHATTVPGQPAREVDPTGAGDTFCGATLAALARGEHPVMAARAAMPLAAAMIGQVGPQALFSAEPAPAPEADPRVSADPAQVERIAALVAELPEAAPFDFVGDDFPPLGHPRTLDFFFSAVLQQFGFWTAADGRYHRPLVAPLGGAPLKGSDYLWRAYRRWLNAEPESLQPDGQARLGREEFAAHLRSDAGAEVLPALDLHWEQARAYGLDMRALGWTPAEVLARANAAARPLTEFLTSLDHVGGYKEDPLRKKAALLALCLSQRPERFLQLRPEEDVPPVIDYHLMRSCLRTGLVAVYDAALARALAERRELSAPEEWAVRLAAYAAIQDVAARSGRRMGAVDWFFFNARRRCPEMTEPECPRCAVDPVCAHRRELFQPVIRTVFY